MAVIEAGLIVNGMPIIRSVYYPDERELDPFIRTSLLTAIQTFAAKAFNDEAEEMKLKRYSILIKDLDPGTNEHLLLYSVAEKGTDISAENPSRSVRFRRRRIFQHLDSGE